MIEFRRDKEGNLYTVKDGKTTGRILAFGDVPVTEPKEEKKTEKRRS